MTAPKFRSVCQLTGEKAEPTAFFRALSEADEFCSELAELERLREENAALRARVTELEAELAWHTTDSSAVGADDPAAERAALGSPRPGAAHPTTK